MDEFEKEAIKTLSGIKMCFSNNITEHITTMLYLEPEEIPMEELAKKTGYSLATISNNVAFLEHTGLIKKTRKPGSKKIFIYMEKDVIETMKNHFVNDHMNMIISAKEKLPALIEKYSGKLKTEEDRKKLKIIDNFYKQNLKMEIILKELIKKIDEISERRGA
jgi:DNA-binding transcriptional regulator GbsR (MarR family)